MTLPMGPGFFIFFRKKRVSVSPKDLSKKRSSKKRDEEIMEMMAMTMLIGLFDE